jgi:hypothetical protein
VTVEQWDAVVESAGGWPNEELRCIAPEVEEVQQLVAERSGRGRGQGFAIDAATRQVIEKRAMQLATEHLEAEGWQVADVSLRASFDLHCTKPTGEELRVEVKGTTSEGSQVLLTANEVEHARTHYPKVVLIIVSHIGIARSSGNSVEAKGGRVIILNPWLVDDRYLKPLSYSYNVAPSLP